VKSAKAWDNDRTAPRREDDVAEELHWDHPARRAEREAAMRDPNPHLRHDPYIETRLAKEVEEMQRLSGREVNEHIPTNFLPPSQRTVTTTPAGTSVYVTSDPRPNRSDPNVDRLQRAALARQIASEQRLSGTSTSVPHGWDASEYIKLPPRRDAAGRIVTDWAKAHRQPDEPD
jgi:hypothetical protein